MLCTVYVVFLQEDERRIASVMARKEEEKRRESNKINMIKVGTV